MSPAAKGRYAGLATLAAETALAVGERIKVDDIAIVTRKRGRANFATAAARTLPSSTYAIATQ